MERLERDMERMNERLEHLQEFILPGGNRAAATCHLARTVCRRAERELVTLSKCDAVSPLAIRYLNRLSDVLFVAARAANQSADAPEVYWSPKRNETKP